MTAHQHEIAKNITISANLAYANVEGAPTREEVEAKVKELATIFGYEGQIADITSAVLASIDSKMGAGVSLIDIQANHDDLWVEKRDDITWTYSDAYEGYLKQEGWSPNVVQSLSDVSYKILSQLQNPLSDGQWDRRGLTIGHVQSGKTANYLGVVSRAADVGYKFIIIIAGIHNNLRKQTQGRVDEGFVGRSSDPEARVDIGVGMNPGYPNPVTLTTIYDDFNKSTANKSGWKLNDFTKPIVLVIKKNVRTLDSLYKWLKELNAQKGDRITDVPMLLIDDEADNASINTNKEDLDPTKTNKMLRQILGLFDKSCYVGYTATPFANIFINPEAYAGSLKELFPRDFIYCLDAPNTYFGPEKVFLDDVSSEAILSPILDCENYLPLTHKKGDEFSDLPPSLYKAVRQFVIARAIRNLRGHRNKHCSMMVNVSRFVNVQRTVKDMISVYEDKLRKAVKANYAMPEKTSDKNAHMRDLKDVFEADFSDCGHLWQDVKSELYSAFEHLRLFVINSKSDEALDYNKYEKDGVGLTALAIGGLSLSRGLTIEGLTISYMYRNTRMYDTLMQMGRWFGYRFGFEDLCKVHLAPDSIDWYAHIAAASEELRQQIKRMRRDGLSPRQFGLYVQAHPDRLLITAANKMRSGEKITVQQNFSGRLIESYAVSLNPETNSENEELIAKFWQSKFGGKAVTPNSKGWEIIDVPVFEVEKFILEFQAHSDFAQPKSAAAQYLSEISAKYPAADVLLISLKENGEDQAAFRLGAQTRKKATVDGEKWTLSKNRVASRGDEKLGLSPEQVSEAVNKAKEDSKSVSDYHYRSVRQKPLLMVHVLDAGNMRVPAFGVSFPDGDYTTTVEVVANPVWIEQMYGGADDDPDDEEDWDD